MTQVNSGMRKGMDTTAKFPRIPHLPWSPGGTRDDKRLPGVGNFLGRNIVITEKMDGSNLCMTHNCLYARSHSGAPTHKSFNLAKALHAQIKHTIPQGLSIFGEWCYAVHSIKYTKLPDYFLIFATRQDISPPLEFDVGQPYAPFWWNWDVVKMRAANLMLCTVPILYRGKVESVEEFTTITNGLASLPSQFGPQREGLVIRIDEDIENENFEKFFAKWVRKDHVQTDEHWLTKSIEKQGLA